MATTATRVTPVVTKIIDGDGHLYERDEDIIPYLQGKYPEETLRTYYLFPTLDGWRRDLPPRGTATTPRAGHNLWTTQASARRYSTPPWAWPLHTPRTPTGE